MKLKLFITLLFSVIIISNNFAANILNDDKDKDKHKHEHIHFAHPLVTETPSPDTKVRLDYFYKNINSGGLKDNTIRFEAEYAFNPSFSIEVDLLYTILNPSLGSTESNFNNINIGFKFANYSFEENNILLGYGLEFGIPSGDQNVGIGSNHIFNIEPFFSIGYKLNKLDIIGHIAFGIPTNLDENVGDEFENEFESNLSFLYQTTERLQLLLEFDRSVVIAGEESGISVLNISPGVKFQPLSNPNLLVGVSVGFPLTDLESFDTRVIGSVFFHF